MIAVSFALPAESSALVALLRHKRTVTRGDDESVQGKVDKQSVEIFHTGVGQKSCESKIDSFFRGDRPQYFIAAGFAGAVRDDIETGELILGENFSHPSLLREAQRLLDDRSPRVAKLFTSPRIVDSIEERNAVARARGADVVDMETEIIAQACAARDIPMLSLRVVSDSPSNPFPAPPNVLFDIQLQRTNSGDLLGFLAKHPPALWRLLRFSQQVSKARSLLAKAIVDLVRDART
jgi:adenosylhomocysteine nucleosidase